MMLLLPGNAKGLKAVINPAHYGWLLTAQRTMTRSGFLGLTHYAVDNECFARAFEPKRFFDALERIKKAHGLSGCLFVVSPDSVGNAKETLTLFFKWREQIAAIGFPVALAAQDGLENESVPWYGLDALFIGGSTTWKLGEGAASLLREAQAHGKWTHVGRVNSIKRASRLRVFPDSVDGTAWAKHPAEYVARWSKWITGGKHQQSHLF